jgi:serine protease Do
MEQSPVVKVVKKILPAVVSITISKYLPVFESPLGQPLFGFEEFFEEPKAAKKIKVGGGSGFIAHPSGLILTNRHVVADPEAEYIVILNNGEKKKARILASDPIADIAILKIDAENLPVVELGDSSILELGQTVVAVGNVLGTFRNTVSVGVVSGLSREIMASQGLSGETARLRGLIQTDAAVNPGNSGGPLVNIEGKAIGINAAMVLLAQSIGFALPINSAKKDLSEVEQYGRIRQPFLGVRYVLLNKKLQEAHNLPANKGALVVSEPMPGGMAVLAGGPAAKAGIKEGDIILAVEKEEISSKNPLLDILQKFKVGDAIELRVLRGQRELKCKLVLGEKK